MTVDARIPHTCDRVAKKRSTTTSPCLPSSDRPASGRSGYTLVAFRSDPIGFLRRLAAEHGDVAPFRMARRSFLLVNDPTLIGQVLTAPADQLGRGPGLLRTRPILGDGLLTNDCPAHREKRRRFQPAFTQTQVDGYRPSMLSEADEIVAGWRDGDVVDIHREMTRLTLGIVAKTLFGYDGVDTAMADRVGNAVSESVAALYGQLAEPVSDRTSPQPSPWKGEGDRSAPGHLGATPAALSGRDGRRERLRCAVRELDEVLSQIVASEGRLIAGDGSRDDAITFLLAGHESVSNALSWTCHLLAQDQAVQDQTASDAGTDSADAPYVQAVIRESLRLFPPAWMMSRTARVAVDLSDRRCEAGDIVVVAPCVTHRDSRFFPDPDEFRPRRWFGETRHPRYAYFPFGAGHRACIGERFAMAEMTVVLRAILSRWRLCDVGDGTAEALPAVTLRPRYGVRIRLEAR